MLKDLGLALAGADPTGLAHMLREQWFHSETPRRVLVDDHAVAPSGDWLDRYAHASRSVAAFFGPGPARSLVLHQGRLAKATFDFDGGPEQLVETLSGYPFDIASFRSRHREWQLKENYSAPGFGGSHYPHGWACAFRGEGHRRLVSRRWLEAGPWRLHRAPDDTTLVQFHDLGLDASAALERARPAHRRMGHSDEGGFLHEPYKYRNEIKGFYDAERRVLKTVILGRTVSSVEMRDACAIRRDRVRPPRLPWTTSRSSSSTPRRHARTFCGSGPTGWSAGPSSTDARPGSTPTNPPSRDVVTTIFCASPFRPHFFDRTPLTWQCPCSSPGGSRPRTR